MGLGPKSREIFRSTFGESPHFELDVPARICVFGDHSDYVPWLSSNIVTFGSSEQRMRAYISPRSDGLVKVATSLEGCEDSEFSIQDVEIVGDWLEALNTGDVPQAHWSNYVKGAVAYLGNKLEIQNGFEMFIDSTIPAASGASSSSALTLCGLVAAHLANNISWTPEGLSIMGGEAEWYVGTRGGMMDHATMMFAEDGRMVKLEFRPFGTELVADGLGCKWFSVFTHPADKGGLVRDAFNELAYVQQEVVPKYIEKIGTVDDLQSLASKLPETIEHERFGLVRVRDRFQFVLNEFIRAKDFISILGDTNQDEVVKLFEASWNDTRDLLGTHTDEMEGVAAKLREKEGVLGVKVLGAGFGGNLLVCAKGGVNLGAGAVEHTPGAGLQLVKLD
ncbi:MAG: hypothetical protein VX473_05965 [Candidatus Thermoplasmatota archaeon]|nr:hypothetical protein [Candidatus Thermoplasmatota archaeon]